MMLSKNINDHTFRLFWPELLRFTLRDQHFSPEGYSEQCDTILASLVLENLISLSYDQKLQLLITVVSSLYKVGSLKIEIL